MWEKTDISKELNDPAPCCRGCLGGDLSLIGHKDGFDLLRCADCKTVIAGPLPSEEELARYYYSHGKTSDYLRKRDAKIRRGLHRVKKILRARPPGRKFLDIGCNIGFTVEAAHQLGLEAYGIDIDTDAIEQARLHYPAAGRFEAVPVEDYATRGDTFDMIYMSEVVEHVRDPDTFIAAVAKLLRPGGVLYITAPDGAHFAVPRDFASWGMVCPPQHLTFFSRTGMKKLLARHGLDIRSFSIAFKPGIKALARKTEA
ncbi:MAG: class I SAM-dependent methyltransferase [Alphaproteobacteria bacterium]|nr:class I SAM-dependent methyltransferase [Alphaproteobacteria bacterium]